MKPFRAHSKVERSLQSPRTEATRDRGYRSSNPETDSRLARGNLAVLYIEHKRVEGELQLPEPNRDTLRGWTQRSIEKSKRVHYTNVLFGEDSKERCRRSPNRVKRNTASSGAVNATRSYSKRPSPSETEYEIARVRGDALVRCSPRCKKRVVQVPPAKARRPSPAADSPKNTPGLTQPSAAEVSTATHTASTTGDRR